MEGERKTLTQLSVPICLETLFYMLSGMVDTLMLSSVSDQAVGAVGTANTYIGVFIIMFGVISSGMVAVMSQNIGAGKPGIAYQARQLGLVFNAQYRQHQQDLPYTAFFAGVFFVCHKHPSLPVLCTEIRHIILI